MKKIIIAISFCTLLAFPQIVTTGAANGLTLWFYNVIPALFPAMCLISFVMQLYGNSMTKPLYFMIFAGMLCGYPIGAVTYRNLKNQQQQCPDIYEKLLPFVNITSPAFLLNYVLMTTMYGMNQWLLILTIYAPVVVCVVVTLIFNREKACRIVCPDSGKSVGEAVEKAVNSSLENILKMGVYIIMCSVVCQLAVTFLAKIPGTLFCGVLEITTGVFMTSLNITSEKLRFIITCTICAFGGLSCLGQTRIVAGNTFRIKKYICRKLLLALLTCLTACLTAYVFL